MQESNHKEAPVEDTLAFRAGLKKKYTAATQLRNAPDMPELHYSPSLISVVLMYSLSGSVSFMLCCAIVVKKKRMGIF